MISLLFGLLLIPLLSAQSLFRQDPRLLLRPHFPLPNPFAQRIARDYTGIPALRGPGQALLPVTLASLRGINPHLSPVPSPSSQPSYSDLPQTVAAGKAFTASDSVPRASLADSPPAPAAQKQPRRKRRLRSGHQLHQTLDAKPSGQYIQEDIFPAPAAGPYPAPAYGGEYAPSYYEPKPYGFGYHIEDPYTGNVQGHQQDSDGRTVTGEYKVLLPDGRLQIVSYIADHLG